MTDTHTILHILRNPYGHNLDEIKAARLAAADLIESLAAQPKGPAPAADSRNVRIGDNEYQITFLADGLHEVRFVGPVPPGGAGGDVGADVVQLVRWAYEDAALMVEQEDPRTSDWMWDDRNDLANAIHRRCEETIQGLATPAAEVGANGTDSFHSAGGASCGVQGQEEEEPEEWTCNWCNGTGIDGIDRGESIMPRCGSCHGSGTLLASKPALGGGET